MLVFHGWAKTLLSTPTRELIVVFRLLPLSLSRQLTSRQQHKQAPRALRRERDEGLMVSFSVSNGSYCLILNQERKQVRFESTTTTW